MIPFPGQSQKIDDAHASDGGYLWGDIAEKGGPSRTIGPGIQWDAWVYPSSSNRYLEDPGQALQVWWAVVVTAGSGTLAARDDYDPDFAYNPAATLARDLGAVTVTGPGTYLFATTFTAADIISNASGAFAFRLTCPAGSVDVDQVMLRVFPPGGPVGGWSETLTAGAQEPTTFQHRKHLWSGSASVQDGYSFEAGQPVARSIAAASAPTDEAFSPPAGTAPGSTRANWPFATFQATDDPDSPELSGTTVIGLRLELSPGAPAGIVPDGVEGVDWIVPPDSTDDLTLAVGDPTYQWSDSTVTVYATPGVSAYISSGGVDTQWVYWGGGPVGVDINTGGAWLKPSTVSGQVHTTPTGEDSIDPTISDYEVLGYIDLSATPISLGQPINLTVTVGGLFADQPPLAYTPDYGPGYQTAGGVNAYIITGSVAEADLRTRPGAVPWAPISYVATPSPYQYWIPTAAPRPALQWKSRSDGRGMDGTPSWRRGRATTHAGQWRGTT